MGVVWVRKVQKQGMQGSRGSREAGIAEEQESLGEAIESREAEQGKQGEEGMQGKQRNGESRECRGATKEGKRREAGEAGKPGKAQKGRIAEKQGKRPIESGRSEGVPARRRGVPNGPIFFEVGRNCARKTKKQKREIVGGLQEGFKERSVRLRVGPVYQWSS